MPEQSAKPIARWNSSRDCWEGEGIDLLSGLSDVYSETFTISGSMRNGVAYELPTSGPHTNDSESSSSQRGEMLPTPAASVANDGEGPETWLERRERVKAKGINGNGMGMPLTIAVQLLPTPEAKLATSGPDYARAERDGSGGHDLATAAFLLPTPRASDGEKGGPNQRGSKGDLTVSSAIALLPTPKAGDADFGMPRTSGRTPEKSTHLMTRLTYTLPVGPDLCEKCGHDDLVHDADGFCASCSPRDCRDIHRGGNLLPTPCSAAVRSSRSTMLGASKSSMNIEQAAEVASGVLPREFESWDEVRVGGGEGEKWGPYAAAIERWEQVLGRPAPEPTEAGPKGGRRLSALFVEWLMGLPEGWLTDPAIGLSRTGQLRALGNGVVSQQAGLALRLTP